MVERPIKKSERPAKPDATDSAPKAQPFEDSSKSRTNNRGADKRADKRKKFSREEEPKQGGNLALMRGPKPTKPKMPVIAEEVAPEVSEDTATEATTETTEIPTEG